MFPTSPPRSPRLRDKGGPFVSPTFPRFFDLPAEIKLEVLYASLDSRERIVDPDLSAPRWPEASECFQPVSIHDYQKQARFLKHARNLSQVNKYFQEEVAKRLLRDVKVVLNHSVCTNEAAWCTCDHLHWSETLRHLRQPGLTTPPGPTEACQLYPRDPSSQLEFFDSIRCGYQQHSNQVRPDHTELVAIGGQLARQGGAPVAAGSGHRRSVRNTFAL